MEPLPPKSHKVPLNPEPPKRELEVKLPSLCAPPRPLSETHPVPFAPFDQARAAQSGSSTASSGGGQEGAIRSKSVPTQSGHLISGKSRRCPMPNCRRSGLQRHHPNTLRTFRHNSPCFPPNRPPRFTSSMKPSDDLKAHVHHDRTRCVPYSNKHPAKNRGNTSNDGRTSQKEMHSRSRQQEFTDQE